MVGFIAGAGELVGYALRVLFGWLADRTGRPWLLLAVGYAVNLLAVPLLALAGRWEVAAALMVAERLGKAIRAPSRDAVLSAAATKVGAGWGFGLHEAMDQIGAIAGPLVVAAAMTMSGSYRTAFAVLLVPALLALAALAVARLRAPRPLAAEAPARGALTDKLPPPFWLYAAAAACLAAGFTDFPLLAFHLQRQGLASAAGIPLLYALAMAVDAVAALLFGRLFDRFGVAVLAGGAAFTASAAPLVFLGGPAAAVGGIVAWGVGMGAQESVVRAAVATLVPATRRGSAYGSFGAVFGIAWFAGSALMGVLYDVSVPALVAFAVGAQAAALPLLAVVARNARAGRRRSDTGR